MKITQNHSKTTFTSTVDKNLLFQMGKSRAMLILDEARKEGIANPSKQPIIRATSVDRIRSFVQGLEDINNDGRNHRIIFKLNEKKSGQKIDLIVGEQVKDEFYLKNKSSGEGFIDFIIELTHKPTEIFESKMTKLLNVIDPSGKEKTFIEDIDNLSSRIFN